MALFIVTNSNDSGTGSLREALAKAEDNGTGEDTIRFDASLSGQTVWLESTLTITQGTVTVDGDTDGDGDPDIILSGDIDNTGADEGDLDILLQISSGATANVKSVHFTGAYSKGLDAIEGSDATAGLAGIINAGTLNITDSALTAMKAVGGHGDSVPPRSPEMAIAGIYNAGELTISDSYFAFLTARGGEAEPGYFLYGKDGGNAVTGILSTFGNVTISGSLFSTLDANGGGGGDGGTAFYYYNTSIENFDGYDGGDGGAAIGALAVTGGIANANFGYQNIVMQGGTGGVGGQRVIFRGGVDGNPGATGNTTVAFGALGIQHDQSEGSRHEDNVVVESEGRFFGVQGNDYIDARAYSTLVYGGAGHDIIITGGAGKAYGGSGNDYVVSTYFNQSTVDGGAGNDTFSLRLDPLQGLFEINLDTGVVSFGYARNFENAIGLDAADFGDTIKGTSGANILEGLAGADTLYGYGGDDALYTGNNSGDRAFGGNGDDVIVAGNDSRAYGQAGKDLITTYGVYAQAHGGGGSDTIMNYGINGGAIMDGGGGSDLFDASKEGHIGYSTHMNLGTGAGRIFKDNEAEFQVLNFENITGRNDATAQDTIIGNGGANILSGLKGDDKLKGGGGDDLLKGGSQHDMLFGQGGKDQLFGQSGNDDLQGGGSADKLFGGGGQDAVHGGGGDDKLFGGGGDDSIQGGGGDDISAGGSGKDQINGGRGADTATGNGGKDTFVYKSQKDSGTTGKTRDKILDFDDEGNDTIDLSGFKGKLTYVGTVGLSGKNQVSVEKQGKHVLVEVSTDNDAGAEFSLLLKNTKIADMGEGDFIL